MIRIHLKPTGSEWLASVEGRDSIWARGRSAELAFAQLAFGLRDELGIVLVIEQSPASRKETSDGMG